jgi:hypothetical protein
LEADLSFDPLFLGGWTIASAREGHINDNFFCFLLRSKNTIVNLEEFEIDDARW